MTTQPKIILVAGANGQLGQLMLTALQDRAARNGEALLVRALVRQGRPVPAPTPTLVYEAIDYTNPADLARVSEGAFAVVCCLLGVEDVIIGVQSGLLKSALDAGARRFIPSDFSGDFTKLPEGAHRNFDWRRQFHRIAAQMIAKSGAGMDFTSIYQGGFTELLASGWVLFDYKKLQVPYFGAADAKMEFTTYADTAEYTAAVALDDAPTPAALYIAGARLSPQTAAALGKRITGADFALKHVMQVWALRLVIGIMKRVKPDRKNPMPLWVVMQYGYCVALGVMSPARIDNDRYPGMQWTSVDDTVRTAFIAAGHQIHVPQEK